MSEQLPNQPEASQPKPAELAKTVYVKRSNGEVSTMRVAENAKAGEDGTLRAYIVEQDEETGEEYIAGYKPISGEALSDEVQIALGAEYGAKDAPEQVERAAEAAPLSEAQEEIADVAIEVATGIEDPSEIDGDAHNFSGAELKAMREASQRATGLESPAMITSEEVQSIAAMNKAPVSEASADATPSPADVLKGLTEGLSADDLLELRSYAEATDEVRDAQKEGRGEDSTYWQQIKGQSLRTMSARAQSVANRYAGYYNQVK